VRKQRPPLYLFLPGAQISAREQNLYFTANFFLPAEFPARPVSLTGPSRSWISEVPGAVFRSCLFVLACVITGFEAVHFFLLPASAPRCPDPVQVSVGTGPSRFLLWAGIALRSVVTRSFDLFFSRWDFWSEFCSAGSIVSCTPGPPLGQSPRLASPAALTSPST
jgi:hypothetical protein